MDRARRPRASTDPRSGLGDPHVARFADTAQGPPGEPSARPDPSCLPDRPKGAAVAVYADRTSGYVVRRSATRRCPALPPAPSGAAQGQPTVRPACDLNGPAQGEGRAPSRKDSLLAPGGPSEGLRRQGTNRAHSTLSTRAGGPARCPVPLHGPSGRGRLRPSCSATSGRLSYCHVGPRRCASTQHRPRRGREPPSCDSDELGPNRPDVVGPRVRGDAPGGPEITLCPGPLAHRPGNAASCGASTRPLDPVRTAASGRVPSSPTKPQHRGGTGGALTVSA